MKATRCSVLTTAVIAVTTVVAPAADAKGAGGYAGPAQSFGAGVTGPPQTPAGASRFSTLTDDGKTTVVETDTHGGEVRASRTINGVWGLPAVTDKGEAGGLSADGGTLVLIHPPSGFPPRETEYLVLDAERLRVRERIAMDGFASYDAISPDGSLAYFVLYDDPVNPFEYAVRAYDLERDRLLPGEVVDPEEPDEQMAGQPVARATSPDGRWTYTAYAGGKEAFIHALDTQEATAVCVDLTQFTPQEAYRLEIGAADGTIRVLHRGELTATVDPETFEVTPVSEEAAPTDSGGFPWAPAAVAAVVMAVAAVALVGFARRRRRRAEEAELGEVFAAAETQEGPEAEREPEPVP
jgi:hypothetical protein